MEGPLCSHTRSDCDSLGQLQRWPSSIVQGEEACGSAEADGMGRFWGKVEGGVRWDDKGSYDPHSSARSPSGRCGVPLDRSPPPSHHLEQGPSSHIPAHTPSGSGLSFVTLPCVHLLPGQTPVIL
ncbi:hypothetical protein C8Q77DRAFT_446914 [Trametes polyzona]|nr:hypothetical protein C8Q77DRAFT_446914 [Trametes polyzona]